MNEIKNASTPMMGTYGNVAPMAAGSPTSQQEMMAMWMQCMSQMMAGQMPQVGQSPKMMQGQVPQMVQGQVPQVMMVPWFPPMSPQVQMMQQGQMQQPMSTPDTLPSGVEGGKDDVDEDDANDPISKDVLLTKKEVMALLKISDTSLWRRNKEGKLMYIKEGGRVMYRSEDVTNYINSLKTNKK